MFEKTDGKEQEVTSNEVEVYGQADVPKDGDMHFEEQSVLAVT